MITLYTTGCPRCKVLETKLNQTGLKFGVVNDPKKIIEMGFVTAPVMTVDGKPFGFKEAINYLNDYSTKDET